VTDINRLIQPASLLPGWESVSTPVR